MEPRFDCKVIVVGHLAAGKTTLILRFLRKHFAMSETESTNGIVIIRKNAKLLEDGNSRITECQTDTKDVLGRIKTATAKGRQTYFLDHDRIPDAEEIYNQILSLEKETDSVPAESHEEPLDEKYGIESQEHTTCKLQFMDFAGQSIFNSTHQMFMCNTAIYLLVFDISKQLESEVEDDDVYCLGVNRRMSVEDLTEFLLNTIHAYSGDPTDNVSKVFLVGTHKDKEDEVIARQRMERIKKRFENTPLQKHVRGDFIVDCVMQDDPEIDQLRKSVFAIVKQEPYWGQKFPTRWLPLENSIIDRRDRGERVLTLQTIKQMNESCFVKINTEHEIERFLKRHDGIGNFMYFGGNASDDIVILDPQWLIDALKQIVTHERFYLIPEGLQTPWKDFTECAKLHKQLVEAVWSQNKDKTFIDNKEKLLTILKQTDIIASPLIYSTEGSAEDVDYYFVPSMLKPNLEGKAKIDALLRLCSKKSPSLCFVFDNKFMQPAIFQRIQCECTNIYKLKEVHNQPLLFYQSAVFQLNQDLDFVLQQEGHVIKVTVVNENEANMNSDICQNVRVVLEDALSKIVLLYRSTRAPFFKAIQCKEASTNLDELITWSQLEKFDNVMCKAHRPEEWHRVSKDDVIGPWLTHEVANKTDNPLAMKGHILPLSVLNCIDLARLARRLNSSDLLLAIRTEIPETDWQHSRFNNKDDIVGEVYDTLVKWGMKTKNLTLNMVYTALKDSHSNITFEKLREVMSDKDHLQHLKDFDQEFLETTVNDEAIDLIAQRSARTYKFLALEVGIEQHVIETVVQDIKGVTHRAKNLLNKWRTKTSSPTYREIGCAIIEVDGDLRLLIDCQQLVMKMVSQRSENEAVKSKTATV